MEAGWGHPKGRVCCYWGRMEPSQRKGLLLLFLTFKFSSLETQSRGSFLAEIAGRAGREGRGLLLFWGEFFYSE